MGLDPLTAALNAYAATVNYATVLRQTMSQENRDKWDALWPDDYKRWRDLIDKLTPKGTL